MVKKAAKPGLDLAKVGAEKPAKQLLVQPAAGQNERVRIWIVGLIFIVYALLIFEGVLRKWALPGMHSILFFIRDPFVLLAYILAIKYRMWPALDASIYDWLLNGGGVHTFCCYAEHAQ